MASIEETEEVVTSLSDGRTGSFAFWSASPFEFKHILTPSPPPMAQLLRGELQLPKEDLAQPGFRGRLPCVIGLHGSLGWAAHHHLHLANLREHGIATFRLDSFLSRGVSSTAERQLDVTMACLMHDAYAALDLVCTHPLIDATRVGVVGWSLGGGAAAYSALAPVAARLGGPAERRFAGHLGFYPDAHYVPVGPWRWTPAPVTLFQGAVDDYTTEVMSQALVDRANAQGARMSLRSFPGSHHSFDRGSLMEVHFAEKVAVAAGTVDLYHPTGHVHITGFELGSAPVTEYAERRAHGRKYTRRGAHIGGNEVQAAAACRDVVSFFRATLLGDVMLAEEQPLQVTTLASLALAAASSKL